LASVDTATSDVVAAKIVDLILDCVVDMGWNFFSFFFFSRLVSRALMLSDPNAASARHRAAVNEIGKLRYGVE
jgi:hypothetical protein